MPAPVRERPAAKKAVNLSIDRDLLQQARALKVNLSRALEEQLAAIIRQERARRWQEENREAIEAHNRFVESTACSTTFESACSGAVRRPPEPGGRD